MSFTVHFLTVLISGLSLPKIVASGKLIAL